MKGMPDTDAATCPATFTIGVRRFACPFTQPPAMTDTTPSSSASAASNRPAPVVLVTGAAQRIGREIALHFARQGWRVAVHYGRSAEAARETASACTALGQPAYPLQADLGDERQTRQLVAACLSHFGQLDCIVNNASVFEYDNAADFRYDHLARHMASNAAAPIALARTLHASMPESARAAIINLLDQKLYNPNPDYLSYTLSKAALHEATRLLAQALAPRLRVNAVAPGLTLISDTQTPENFEHQHTAMPLGRGAEPADIAAAVHFLATATAITGVTLCVDGGQHLQPSARDVMFQN